MTMFLSILAFAAVGALIGFLGYKLFSGTSLLVSIFLGLAGSFGISWVAKLLHFGTGFLSISLWGMVAGILGACLFVGIYGFIMQRRLTRSTTTA